MSSMKSNPYKDLKKTTLKFAALIFLVLLSIDFFLQNSRIKSKKAEIVLDILKRDEKLTNEIYRLINGLEDDLSFFEKEIFSAQKSEDEEKVKPLISFMETHPHYIKLRLATIDGKELFKIVNKTNGPGFQESKEYFVLGGQKFFDDLKKATHDSYFFSPMDANIIDGKTEQPLRPTIRVSKRTRLLSGSEGILILNIDGHDILNLFTTSSGIPGLVSEKILLDDLGNFVASYPLLPLENYTISKKMISAEILSNLNRAPRNYGSFDFKDIIVTYTKLSLPRTNENWFMISMISEKAIRESFQLERLTWLFWEMLFFCLGVTWFWKSEKKRYHEQVVKVLLHERSEFIENVSHQLKTPLAIINNYLSQPERTSAHITDLRSEVSHLIKVIDDLLLLSHVESFKEISLQKESVLEVVSQAIDLVAEKAKEKKINMKFNLKEDLLDSTNFLERYMMPELMKSAISNILVNAIDHGPTGSDINIGMYLEGSRIFITIKDDGPGIPDSFIPMIFNRFTRAQDQERKGSGLGLAISRKIIELHGGAIRLSSNTNGATFEIIL